VKLTVRLSLCGLVLGFAIPSAHAQNQPGTTYLCWIRTNTDPSLVYRSGAFHVAANTSLSAINDAFQNYLRKNYHLQFSGSVCGDLFNDPDGQRYIQQLEQAAKTNKREIVLVDWKYVPGQDTPPPPQAVAERTILYYCSAYFGPNGGENLAWSDSFEAPQQTDINRVRDDFVKFVREKYSAKDASGGCSTADNKPKEESNMRGHKKFIETGWKPKTFPKADSRH
jgi:hypothetical protein